MTPCNCLLLAAIRQQKQQQLVMVSPVKVDVNCDPSSHKLVAILCLLGAPDKELPSTSRV